ncbi:MAG: ATP-binding cassette domain-containing protein [Lachnospiraceae bacterium]|nr:ATP-binding cassette domain-containing protein [Lachnospiraceae bacterium]
MKIELIDITKKIKNKTVLENVDMTLETGKIYGLAGENGSGKTMLMRVLSGLIRPSGGKIKLDDREIHAMDLATVKVGLVLENTSLYNSMTGFENLMYLGNLRSDIRQDRVNEMLDKVGLDPTDKRKYSTYSLGMKQKLAIAQAFLEYPNLLLLDEPTNAIDEESCKKIRKLIMEGREERITLLVSHDRSVIDDLCDIIYTIADGKVRLCQ